ncbi:prephenate dehydrogenase/arogenate dehydrogenase family protein [Halovivax sp.]|uniref:prephenate dehydrogenase/arogenate dehydrogenase family protein n=1 Tax=Halovivax sp. TaxID=1935978 RepID=UPI0025BA37B1|nr:prephenate dehydrogenase/arogenate dehydrogenase family protein [Halovivax sp.]
MDVLIVGAGTMGRWVGDTVDGSITFADVDEAAARDAAEAVGGRTAPLDPAADDASYDVVCLAVPMTAIEDAVARHAPRAESAVVDVAGVMEPALAAMERHAPERERLSLHPLFAPDRAPGAVPFVRGAAGPRTDAVLADLEAAGNDLVETTADEHDGAMESVQAAAHASVLAFAIAADRVPSGFETPVYGDLRRLVERVTGGTPRVYADIQSEFDGAEAVAEAAARIAAADADEFESLLEEVGAEWTDGERAIEESTDSTPRASEEAGEPRERR